MNQTPGQRRRPDIGAIVREAFGDLPSPLAPPGRLLRPPAPSREEAEAHRFRLAKQEMDRCLAAFKARRRAEVCAGTAQEWPAQCAGSSAGRPCVRAVHVIAATIPLCRYHADEILQVMAEQIVIPLAPREPEVIVKTVPGGVVYYMGDPVSRNVKIGTTTDLRSRWNQLNYERPGLLILATEPGGYEVERKRHRQFRGLRVQGEWFRKVPLLMEHVNTVRSEHGIIPVGGKLPARALAPIKQLGGTPPAGNPQDAGTVTDARECGGSQ